MDSFKKNFQLKLLVNFLLSSGIAALLTMIIFILLCTVAFGSYDSAVSWINGNVVYMPVFFSVMGICFVIFLGMIFFVLTKRSFEYLRHISKELKAISEGNLDIKVPVKSKDELGRLANDINNMTTKLKQSYDDEKRAEKAKNELINNISHDLRTPLTSIIGYLDLLVEKKYSNEEEMEKFLRVSNNKALWINKLMGQLFEYSRLSSREIDLKTAQINLVEVIDQLMVGFIPRLKEFEMEYALKSAQNPLVINADGLLISRLFENLIDNAICYGKEGKYIEIEFGNLNSNAYVAVSDYGEQISKEQAEKIFDRTYRTDKSRSQNRAGAGLGLSIAKSIARLHNGDIHFEINGKKKSFIVILPISRI